MEKRRNSSFELLRIIGMYMIVLIHIIIHTGVRTSVGLGITNHILTLLLCFLYTFVSVFVLITGYFQCDKEFKLKSIFKINNAMWFYSAILILIIYKYGLNPWVGKTEVLQGLLPIQFGGYWFTRMYLFLYCVSPLLNIIIKNVDKKTFKNILIFGVILFSIIPTLTNNTLYEGGSGYTLVNFILLYFIGAYFKKYPLEQSNTFGRFSKYKRISIFLIIFVLSIMFNFLLNRFGITLGEFGFSGFIRGILTNHTTAYTNPLIITGSLCLFLIFYHFDFSSKFINYIAGLTFGIYLFSDNKYFRGFLYQSFGFSSEYPVITGVDLLVKIFITSIVIYIVGLIIEFIRQLIFKFIYKRKLSKKIRDTFYNIVNNF